jgi:hypothetical protein
MAVETTRKEITMFSKKWRIYLAGLVAFLIGFPLTERAFGGVTDIITSGFDLGFSIADISKGS